MSTQEGTIMKAAAIALALLLPSLAAAQAMRIEIHQISSLTPSDRQFLMGEKDAPSVVIGAELRIPGTPGDSRLPAVILVHGSGGIGANLDSWARELNGMGIATLILDSFTSRNIRNTLNDQSQLGRLAMLVDSYRALDLLSHDPRIDPTRIAIMGFSRGAAPALYTSLRRFQRLWGPPGVSFAAHLAFYAPCYATYIDDTNVGDQPVRLFHGTADDYVPIGPCRSYVARLKAAGKDVQLLEYPDAGHTFDSPRKAALTLPEAQTARNCLVEEKPLGQVVNSKTKRPWDWKDPCVEHGPTVAYQEKAHQQSIKDVKEFLTAALKLK
jgi:dienelactone hydrolase